MRRRGLIGAGATAALLLVAALAAPATAADRGRHGYGPDGPASFGIIGDVPYGAAEIAAFPGYVDDLNAHPELRFVAHLGDIKNGSSVCSDEYFASIRRQFDRFTAPLVYTPGDNEWTDCHRTNNGAYDPLERLGAVRRTFFPRPGVTLGAPARVASQGASGYPENVHFRVADVTVTAVDIPGSNNSTLPWTGLGKTAPTPEQLAEVDARTKADLAELHTAFRTAKAAHSRSVVVLTQADMFDPTVTDPKPADFSAFTPLVTALVQESNAFHGPVYLINGDSHVFNRDAPLAAGSKWLSFYGQATPARHLTRLTVDGSANAQDWLKVTTGPRSAHGELTFERVPFTHPAS